MDRWESRSREQEQSHKGQRANREALQDKPAQEDAAWLDATLAQHFPNVKKRGTDFKKIVSGRKLWNFDKREWKVWQEAL